MNSSTKGYKDKFERQKYYIQEILKNLEQKQKYDTDCEMVNEFRTNHFCHQQDLEFTEDDKQILSLALDLIQGAHTVLDKFDHLQKTYRHIECSVSNDQSKMDVVRKNIEAAEKEISKYISK